MAEERMNGEAYLQQLYGELADVIPEAMAEDFVGMGYAKGRYYDSAQKRILVVEKIPRPDKPRRHIHGHDHEEQEDERDFTTVMQRIVREMLGAHEDDWQEYTAWSYLYKLAQKKGKADDTVIRKQKALCQEIIRAEIGVLNPTHVLFVTGWGSLWDFDLPLYPLLKGEAVEAWGETEDGIRLIVTRYAVRKPDDKFALDVLEKIRTLDEMEGSVADWQEVYK